MRAFQISMGMLDIVSNYCYVSDIEDAMSDGPHRSLPMRRAWRYVAERSDKRAFTAQEISEALTPALEQDCHTEMTPTFLAGIRRAIEEPSLFGGDVSARLEPLRPEAGSGIGRALLDNVALLSTADADEVAVLQEALKRALEDRAYRGARQVEEHYLRKSNAPRSQNVRGRMEQGIACSDLSALADRFLSVKPKQIPRGPAKRAGLDDGVILP
jgi:hypothetical protein